MIASKQTMRVLAAVLLVSLSVPATAQERPLPNAQAFLKDVRERLQSDDERQSNYMYVETRRVRSLDGDGRTTKESVKVYESYPALPGETRWSRLVAVDNKPVRPEDLAKGDRERQKKVQEYLAKRERQTDRDRAEEAKRREKNRREEAAAIDDAFSLYEITMLGRERLDGRDTIAFSLKPRPNVKTLTKEGGVMRHFAGKAWIDETEHELVRLEVEALDTVSFGWGMFARVHKGSHAAFQRRKVNGEEWLPATMSMTASARLLLLKRLRVDQLSEFSNYRRFTVETDATYSRPK